MDPEKIKAALEAIKNGDADAALALLEDMIASAAGATSEESPAEDAPTEALAENPEPAPEDEDEKAMGLALMRLTGAPSVSESIAEVGKLVALRDSVEKERASLERVARRDLVAELVKLGVEFPSTAWEGDPAKRQPVKRLAEEPLDELRARVALHRKTPRTTATPPRDEKKTVALSANEIAACKKRGIDPEVFAARKAAAVRRSA